MTKSACLKSIESFPLQWVGVDSCRNSPSKGTQPGRTFVSLFPEIVVRHSRRLAIVAENVSISYADLCYQSGRIAASLCEMGSGCEVVLGLQAERDLGSIIGMLGILRSGGCFLPVEPSSPPERTRLMLQETGAIGFITSTLVKEFLAADRESFAGIETPLPDPNPSDLAYVIYTSGSTGFPKGVQIEHGALANLVHSAINQYGLTFSDRIMQLAPLSFDVAIEEICPTFAVGAALIIGPNLSITTPTQLMATVCRTGTTVLNLPTPYWHECVHELRRDRLDIPKCLRTVIIGSDVADPASVREWQARCGDRIRLFNAYGPTECTVTAAVFSVPSKSRLLEERTVPIGYPGENLEIYVVSSNFTHSLAGEIGEICISGPQLARGYVARPGSTAEAFAPDPFGDEAGGRMYLTGDFGRFSSDGRLEFHGRRDGQVKIRGNRVELGEVERALSECTEGAMCAVLFDEVLVGRLMLVGYVVQKLDIDFDRNAVLGKLSLCLPSYAVPKIVIAIEELPRTDRGKIDRAQLLEIARSSMRMGSPLTSLFSSTETALADIWKEMLGLESVGLNDDFFLLGGDSLLAARMVSQIADSLNTNIEMSDVFEARTLETLAGRVVEASEITRTIRLPQIRKRNRDVPCALSFKQTEIWKVYKDRPDVANNSVLAVVLHGSLELPAFADALRWVCARHETLRTHFVELEGPPQQVIGRSVESKFTYNEVAPGSDESGISTLLERLIKSEFESPFCLSDATLFRSSVVRLAETEHALVLGVPNILSDKWSMGLILRDISRYYFHLVDGCPLLEDLPFHYADFAQWENRLLRTSIARQVISRLEHDLAGVRVSAQPEISHSLSGKSGQRKTMVIPENVSEALLDVCGGSTKRLFAAFLSLFQTVIASQTGQMKIVVSVPVTGRLYRPDSELVVGPFENMIPIVVDLSSNLTFLDQVRTVNDKLSRAYLSHVIPTGWAIQNLGLPYRPTYNPLAEFTFSLDVKTATAATKLRAEPVNVESGIIVSKVSMSVEVRDKRMDLMLAGTESQLDSYEASLMYALEKAVAAPNMRIRR
jgi:amino acid adenylation domain-containing protein